jgi:hypothetical protein
MTLIARFKVDGFEPRQVAGLDADWVGVLTFAKTFTAGITGQATTLVLRDRPGLSASGRGAGRPGRPGPRARPGGCPR